MRIAVASEGLDVAASFSHCASFTCYQVERGIVVECQNMPNPFLPVAHLANLLNELDVSVLIVDTIEDHEIAIMLSAGIEVITHQRGTAREAMQSYLVRIFSGLDDYEDESLQVIGA